MQYPVNYIAIVRGFKKTGENKHLGMDDGWYSVLHHHQPILATEDGQVIYFKKQRSGGNTVHIRHKINGEYYVSEYGHMQDGSITVRVGQNVKRNQQIGKMGDTGIVDGEHLHYGLCKGKEIKYNSTDQWLDPIKYCEVYSFQKANSKTKNNYKLKYHKDEPELGIYKTLYNMNIRTAPNGPIVKVKQCTTAMQKALTSKKPNDNAVIKKGTKITILEVVKKGNAYWGKNYSGYVCIEDGATKYCKK